MDHPRSKLPAVLAILFCIALLGGVGVLLWKTLPEKQQPQQAETIQTDSVFSSEQTAVEPEREAPYEGELPDQAEAAQPEQPDSEQPSEPAADPAAPDDTPVTDAQKTQVLAKIDEATEILQENGTTDLLSLPKNVRSQLVTIAQDAAKALDLNLTYDNVNKTITVVDKEGNVVAKVEDVVKTTGADTTAAVMTAVTLVALLAGCAVVARKSKLAAK